MMDRDRYFATYYAYGEPKQEPRFLYSRYNLQLKYHTKDPRQIVAGRIEELTRYGYRPSDEKLSRDEQRAAVLCDYLDALLPTYRQRVLDAGLGLPNIESLSTDWEPSGIPADRDLTPVVHMLNNFCNNLDLCMAHIQNLQQLVLPDYLTAWIQAINTALEHDHASYIRLCQLLTAQAGGPLT